MLAAITWGIDPVFFEVFGFEVRYYGLLWALSFYIGFILAKKMYANEGIDVKLMDPLLYACILGGVLGARLGHVIFYEWELFTEHPESVLLPLKYTSGNGLEFTGFAGLASHGGAIGVILALIWYSRNKIKKPLLYVLDIVAIPTALASFFIRFANFMNSEIVGDPTGTDFGVIFSNLPTYQLDENGAMIFEDFARHPAQLYEATCYIVIFALLMWGYWKKDWFKKRGLLIGTFFITAFTARFIIEFVKNSQGGIEQFFGGTVTTGQLLSLPFVAIGIYLVYKALNKKEAN